MQQSYGTMLYRRRQDGDGWEVLIVHPSGAYNRRKPWSIPKGLADPGESPEQAARRETWEETGVQAAELTLLGAIQYTTKSRKLVTAFAGPAPDDAAPHCASWEVDRAEFVSFDEARGRLHPDQAALVDKLEEWLSQR